MGLGLERKGTAAVHSQVSGRTQVDQAAEAQRVVRGLTGAGEIWPTCLAPVIRAQGLESPRKRA